MSENVSSVTRESEIPSNHIFQRGRNEGGCEEVSNQKNVIAEISEILTYNSKKLCFYHSRIQFFIRFFRKRYFV